MHRRLLSVFAWLRDTINPEPGADPEVRIAASSARDAVDAWRDAHGRLMAVHAETTARRHDAERQAGIVDELRRRRRI